jgi:ATP-dependent RNA helicase RhlE
MSRVLIFVNNKKISDMLHVRIDEDFERSIWSNKSQKNYRLSTMASFQEGNLRGLITTDIMARVRYLILPMLSTEEIAMPELYMHRMGRTGRADKSGKAISFIAPREEEAKVEVRS